MPTQAEKALKHIAHAENKTRFIPGLSEDIGTRDIAKVGIIGAGTMGGGIAMCFAGAGIPVILHENNEEALNRGLGVIEKNYTISCKKGRLKSEEVKLRLALITGSLDISNLKSCDLVIEAVFENMDLKKEIFRTLDNICKKGAILATNTSTLDVNEIANVTGRPEDVLGLHFFSPANVMPLLEVVRGDKTSPLALKTAMEIAARIKKTPVISGVCFGFIGNRMLAGYGREAQRMLLEGAAPKNIDSVLEDFGMRMGVLAVYDLAGIDVGHKIRQALGKNLPDDPTYFKAGAIMFKAGRYGQKTRAGFYRYEKGTRQRFDDEEVGKLLQAAAQDLGVAQRNLSPGEILERCIFPLINEGARILEEGIALRASDIDVVWTSGYGFPKERGGPMFYADTIGLKKVLEGVQRYREIFGPEFWIPAPLLERLVRDGKTFSDWDRENS